ncbi:hypothetical protein GQX73_g6378 [Xylaria multiplex]|uniref:SET domain-containing protein n=1 Tax=Xylaria multiplex TaxID=323545 RepID=A0A7C8MRX0_9PEZI|nr:hypothetical protein GQX73_g6378 [Xylaria multiplex]
MRATSCCSFLIATLPMGHALQPYISQNTCSLVDIQDVEGYRDDNSIDDKRSNVWSTSSDCFDEYCVYTNNAFLGEGISLITTASNYLRVSEIQTREAVSRSSYDKARIIEIPGKGKGLVANRTIRKGEAIMAARPALLVHRDAFSELPLEDIFHLMDVAVNNLPKPRKESYLAQAGTMGGHKITDILFTNSFQVAVGGHDGFHYGNFPEVSLLNHDCRPNLAFFIDRNLTHYTHAVRDIEPGEELTISYIDPLQVRSVRQERTRNTLGFSCACSHCTLSENDADASDARLLTMSRIESELADFSSQASSPALIEEYLSLYRREGLEHNLAGAYTLAALNYNLFGKADMAKKYAQLSVEAGLLESGPDAADVREMKTLADYPESHWSWNKKPYRIYN